MKIKVLSEMPVASEIRLKIGSVHEVVEDRPLNPREVKSGANHIYFIKVGMSRIGVLNFECEVVEP